ncbi:hypothetical protein YC2023_064546 [Brassica napus]
MKAPIKPETPDSSKPNITPWWLSRNHTQEEVPNDKPLYRKFLPKQPDEETGGDSGSSEQTRTAKAATLHHSGGHSERDLTQTAQGQTLDLPSRRRLLLRSD